jgi:hypothetical protein
MLFKMERLAMFVVLFLSVLVCPKWSAGQANIAEKIATPTEDVRPILPAEAPTPVATPAVQVYLNTPPKSIWEDIISPIAGLLGVLIGSLLAMRIQTAKIGSERLEADRKYRLERIRDIYSVTLTLLDASRRFHQRYLELVQSKRMKNANLTELLVQARDAFGPVQEAGQKCFGLTFLDAREESGLAKNVHDKVNEIYANVVTYISNGGDDSVVLRNLTELDEITNSHLNNLSTLYEKLANRND